MQSNICVIIPAYNAAATVGQVVRGALKHVSCVLVADDGSVDDTGRIALKAGATVITINKNQGKGHALKQLFHLAIEKGFDAAISLDADGQHDPKAIPLFLNAHQAHPEDLILGSRMMEKNKIPGGRYNSMHIARFFVSLAANQYIEDTQCGYRLYPLGLIKKLTLTAERYTTETEILIKAGDTGTLIRQVPIRAIYENNVSHFRPVIDVDDITAYIISYLWVKWLIEGVCANRPYTYTKGGIRDRIGSHKFINGRFQVFTMMTIFPATVFYFLEYVFLSRWIKNNFASIRNLNCGYFVILRATQMLPILLVVTVAEQVLKRIGLRVQLIKPFINRFYPNLWGGAKA
ncbi:MAG: glycosyltransferase family 2 protein [Desulfobacterales bacterium]|jgi:glycosyltransferase involved in cell wall biosynthesis|nr:glycosyltransferase family 2 protein [Desulfobacterales bacterium]